MSSATTGFGAPWDTPSRTAAVLRAQASAHGAQLAPLGEVAAVAAVVGAHAWSVTSGRGALHDTAGQPRPLIAAAAAVLARSCGTVPVHEPLEVIVRYVDVTPLACPAPLMRLVKPAVDWARATLPEPGILAAALTAAAEDLMAAGSHHLASVGWALLGEAEGLLLDC